MIYTSKSAIPAALYGQRRNQNNLLEDVEVFMATVVLRTRQKSYEFRENKVAVIRECVIVITHHWNCSPTTFDVRKLVSHNKMNFGWRSDFVLLSYGSLGSTGFGTKFHNKKTFSSYLIGRNFNIHLIVC